jgi:hypothetical protein
LIPPLAGDLFGARQQAAIEGKNVPIDAAALSQRHHLEPEPELKNQRGSARGITTGALCRESRRAKSQSKKNCLKITITGEGK